MQYLHPMSTITIPLPDEDLSFLRSYSSAQGTSAEAFLARQARNLREHLQKPLPPDVEAASGILSSAIDAREAHFEHLGKKHL
jgi:hypothetical protein